MSIFKPVGQGEAAEQSALPAPANLQTAETFALSDQRPRNPQDNGVQEHAIAGFVTDRWNRSKNARLQAEQRWVAAYNNYRGQPGQDGKFTATERSAVFIKVTKTKTLAAYGQIIDVLFSNGVFPIGIEPTRMPDGTLEDINVETDPKTAQALNGDQSQGQMQPTSSPYGFPGDGNNLQPGDTRGSLLNRVKQVFVKNPTPNETVTEGPATTPTSITISPAAKAAEKMEKLIKDQLEENDADKHLRLAIFECTLFGTGCLKGPMAMSKELPNWDEQGNYAPEVKTLPKVEAPSIWNVYPDPDALTPASCSYYVERHRLDRQELRALKERPHFRANVIETCIDRGYNYTPEWWEVLIRDNPVTNTSPERFEVLEYWGTIDAYTARLHGFAVPDDFKDVDEVPVNIWTCAGEVIRFVMNPFKPARMPYYLCPYELQPYSPWGVGLAENMSDTQRLMNGFMRMAVDNAALSGSLVFEINQSNLMPGQSTQIHPGKIFFTNGSQVGQSIYAKEFPNVSQQNMTLFDKARELSDEATGLPSFAYGMNNVNPSIGRTSSGMSMMMGAAGSSIRTVIKNVDDYLIRPVGEALFYFNMQFNFDPEIKGDLSIRAMGTDALMQDEVRSQRLTTLIQLTSNPVVAPFLDMPYILRETVKSMELDPNKATKTGDEALRHAAFLSQLAAAQMQQQQQMQQQPGTQGGPPHPQQVDTHQEQMPVAMPGQPGFSAAATQQPTKAPPGQGVS